MSVKSVVGGVLGAFIFVAAPVLARVTQIDVSVVEPFAGGAGFGNTGAYERARGMVEYEADFFLLRPVDAARGNRKIIYDVTNRGRKFIHFRLMDARPPSVAVGNDPKTAEDAGNGLFFRMGYTLAWSGWDSEAPPTTC